MIWIVLPALVALLLLVDAVRMRLRADQLAILAPSDEATAYEVVAAPGVTVDEATRRAASAYARAHGVELLDLIPRDLPAIRSMSLLQVVAALHRLFLPSHAAGRLHVDLHFGGNDVPPIVYR